MSMFYDPSGIPLARPATPIGVFRYDPESGELEPLWSVVPLAIHVREGPEPSTAEFEYLSQNVSPDIDPIYFENVLPLSSSSYDPIVRNDDRVVVVAITPDGGYRYLFDGFAVTSGTQFDDRAYSVGFHAVGVEKRCWDDGLQICWQREGVSPTDPTANIATRLELRFNPKGKANRTPEGFDMVPTTQEEEEDVSEDDPEEDPEKVREAVQKYDPKGFPVFLDELCQTRDDSDNKYVSLWSVSDFAKYVMGVGNDEEYVANPDFIRLDALLDVYTPKKGQQYIDINDPESFDQHPVVMVDYDATGKPWPDALAHVLDVNGFSIAFRLGSDDNDEPQTWIDIYKKQDDDPSKWKDLYLDQWGATLDVSANNVAMSEIQHDISTVANKITLHTAPELVEASFILVPLFEIEASDVDNRKNFISSAPAFKDGDNAKKYRYYGFDEEGIGHWNIANWIWSTDWGDLVDLFPIRTDPTTGEEIEETFVTRPRPARHSLNSKDKKDGTPIRPKLHISVDYAGDTPAVWDGAEGTWYEVPEGKGWALLKDRLGIRLTCPDPNKWPMGPTAGWHKQFSGGDVRCVEWLKEKKVATDTDKGNFFLMLTCVIEGDQLYEIVSERRKVSPTRFEVNRVVDARNEYIPKRIYLKSWTYVEGGDTIDTGAPLDPGAESEGGQTKDNYIDFDDQKAQAFSDGKREAHHLGRFQMRVDIPRYTDAYKVGDRIRSINGRDCSFAMNLGAGIETASYPKVIGITYDLRRGEKTSLILSDVAIVANRRNRGRRM